jgi:uncharacterized protein
MQGSYRIVSTFAVLALARVTLAFAGEPAQDAKSVNEIPPTFTPQTQSFDYVRRIEMIPMRDGVKLYTVILVPRGAKRAPILLTRTPYDAQERTSRRPSEHMSTVLGDSDVDDSTDAYDTIDWLVKNIPESNGKVGILGIDNIFLAKPTDYKKATIKVFNSGESSSSVELPAVTRP